MQGLDASTNQSVFRSDYPQVLASRRDLASIKPVRLAADVDGYEAGQVLAYDSNDGLHKKYGGVSGSLDASCILFNKVDAGATGTILERGIFGGEVYEDLLVDFDSNAKTDLGGRTINSATGSTILKF